MIYLYVSAHFNYLAAIEINAWRSFDGLEGYTRNLLFHHQPLVFVWLLRNVQEPNSCLGAAHSLNQSPVSTFTHLN